MIKRVRRPKSFDVDTIKNDLIDLYVNKDGSIIALSKKVPFRISKNSCRTFMRRLQYISWSHREKSSEWLRRAIRYTKVKL
jgi:hypothetical protein